MCKRYRKIYFKTVTVSTKASPLCFINLQWGKVEEKDTQITNIIFPIQFKSKLLIGLTTDIATSVPNMVVQSINTNYTNKNMEILHANISDAFFFMVLGI